MTPEEIKKTWEKAALKINVSPEEYLVDMMREKKETTLEQLSKKYRRFSLLGLVMACSTCLYLHAEIFPQNLRLPIAVCCCVYFMICSIMDCWLYRGVKSIDCYTMTVREVAEKAMYYRKRHLQFVVILIPLALALLASFLYAGGGDKYFLVGVIAGGVLGMTVGTRQLRDFMAQYRILRDE